jgi:subtilisin family serine protease
MRRGRILAASTAVALAATGLAAAAAGAASTSAATTTSSGAKTSYVVLTDTAAHASSVAAQLKSAGNTVTSVNKAIGLISVTSTKSNFAASAKGISGVKGVSAEHSVGYAPQLVAVGPDPVEKEHVFDRSRPNGTGKYIPPPPPGHDPLDGLLWGMDMINAFDAHATETGDERVTVGVLDTGIQGDHPDLAPNFDAAKSRNFTTDMEDIDGPCEYTGCVDPSFVDNNGHGTHVAGTIGAALNGIGVSGVAPDVTLVNIRGGQDSGFFFLGPTVNALTYAGEIGIDVVNMSFYVDPWLYNCEGGAPEDGDAAAADQDVIIEAMNRALTYAHNNGVSLVGSLGNNHEDISSPRHDFSSPDYNNPDFDWDNDTYERTIDNDTCFDLPVEGPFVIGVSALGPSGMKADYSNYASDLTSGELEVSAPGGYYRDGYGTKSFRTQSNLILSTAPTNVLLAEGLIDKKGKITNDGKALGVLKQCNDAGVCGYYQWLQGTSMASPHAVGVAALAVSAHGVMDSVASRGLTMAPSAVTSLLQSTATDHACPVGVVDYTIVGRSAEYNATCTGTPAFNSFYGAGIVNALGVVQ